MTQETMPWAMAELELGRVLRALECHVAKVDRAYRVMSPSGETYWVQLTDDYEGGCPPCDCADHTFNEVLCKHAIAVLFYERDPRIVKAVGAAVRRVWLDTPLRLKIDG